MQLIVNAQTKEITIENANKKETYSLETAPSEGSQLVLENEKKVLNDLCIDEVLSNLNNAADLMYVAYNALAGTKIQSKMSGRQKDLLGLCQDCVVAVNSFEDRSADIIRYLVNTYKWLINGEEDAALDWLKECGQCARDMADTSEKLATRFETLSNSTEKVLEASQDEENLQYEKAKQKEEELRKFKAEQEGKKKLQETLVTDLEQMQALYEEAKEKESIESDRAFSLGIVSAITSAVGAGVGAFASCYNPTSQISAVTKLLTPSASSDPKVQEVKEKAKTLEKEKTTLEKLEKTAQEKEQEKEGLTEEVKKQEKTLDETKKELSKKEDELQKNKDDSKKSKIEAELQTAKDKVASLEKDIKSQKEKLEQAKRAAEDAVKKAEAQRAVAASISKALADTSESTARMQQQAMGAAQAVHEEKMQYLNNKLKLEKENRETLAALAEYAKLIENTNIEKNIATAAVETLHVAVRCLKKIVTALMAASLFWRSMERYCHNLSKDDLQKTIAIVKKMDPQKKMKAYTDPEFMFIAVLYMARWVALHKVCVSYLNGVKKCAKKVSNNIESAPTVEEAKELAPKLASEILRSVEGQMKNLDAEIIELKIQQSK